MLGRGQYLLKQRLVRLRQVEGFRLRLPPAFFLAGEITHRRFFFTRFVPSHAACKPERARLSSPVLAISITWQYWPAPFWDPPCSRLMIRVPLRSFRTKVPRKACRWALQNCGASWLWPPR